MFGRFKELLADSRDGDRRGAEALRLAVAVLLVEAARMDGRVDAAERRTIARLLGRRFQLADDAAEGLIGRAAGEAERSSQLFGFTHEVNRRLSTEERVGLVEMLWEVAYADGRLHDFESSLMRRLAGLLHVPDAESGAARRRVLSRLGRDGPGATGSG